MRHVVEEIRSPLSDLVVIRSGTTTQLCAAEGTFSVYDSKALFTGFAWDCMSVAAGMRRTAPRRILILGLGAGTVAIQCRRLYPKCCIDGVEVDRAVIRTARRFFRLNAARARVICDDASAFLTRGCDEPYDVVLDDIWPGKPGLQKPLFARQDYIEKIREFLYPGGIFAVNVWCGPGRSSEMRRAARLLAKLDWPVYSLTPPRGPTRALVAFQGEPLAEGISRGRQLELKWRRYSGGIS